MTYVPGRGSTGGRTGNDRNMQICEGLIRAEKPIRTSGQPQDVSMSRDVTAMLVSCNALYLVRDNISTAQISTFLSVNVKPTPGYSDENIGYCCTARVGRKARWRRIKLGARLALRSLGYYSCDMRALLDCALLLGLNLRCAISNSDPKSDVLDRSAIGIPKLKVIIVLSGPPQDRMVVALAICHLKDTISQQMNRCNSFVLGKIIMSVNYLYDADKCPGHDNEYALEPWGVNRPLEQTIVLIIRTYKQISVNNYCNYVNTTSPFSYKQRCVYCNEFQFSLKEKSLSRAWISRTSCTLFGNGEQFHKIVTIIFG
ncbi:hypothetical protein J6590_070988 [Homalodisca vitripennis]|nr:hypothetical protein J6590_070988 [Homalodisca vitripennis]